MDILQSFIFVNSVFGAPLAICDEKNNPWLLTVTVTHNVSSTPSTVDDYHDSPHNTNTDSNSQVMSIKEVIT